MSAEQKTAHRIVVGVDGSRPSIAALEWAVRQAKLTESSVDAVMGWEFPVVPGAFGWTVAPSDDTDYDELAVKALNEAMSQVSTPPGVIINQLAVQGNAATVLLDAAKDADLLVVGNRGHGAFADALIGSVSVRCLHHATCPVVIVRTPRHRS
jgi:nucleotide-binding universal stress UspA family protein